MNLSDRAYDNNYNFVIALDGPSASGKGLIGNMLAKELDLVYVQSSIIYRGLAYICMQNQITPDDTHRIIKLSKTEGIISKVSNIDLNTEIIGELTSCISTIQKVRENLGYHLKKMIQTTPRIVMEGRDIGSVIAPNADLKIFITADINVRAKRRFNQLRIEGKECILSDVLDSLEGRDKRDRTRIAAPLKPAEDALVIDTSDLIPSEVIQTIKNFIGK
ncbi:(d)CMP kinase [Rickettsiaceae bacterium]|nr:(d)CMP kinase [Rickettsiaceae bacterium]